MTKLNLEIVNDSGVSPDTIYIGFYAGSGSGPVSGVVNGKPMETINENVWYSYDSIADPGSVEIETLSGARVYVSFNGTFDAKSGLPSPIDPGSPSYYLRYDKVELTFTGSASDVADLTAIDFSAIPLSLKTLDSQRKEVDELCALKSGYTFDRLQTALGALSLKQENKDLAAAVVKAFGTNLSKGNLSAITNRASAVVEKDSNFYRTIGPNSYPQLGNPVDDPASNPPGMPFTPYGNLYCYLEWITQQSNAGTGFATIAGTFAGTGVSGSTTDKQTYDLKATFDMSCEYPSLTLSGTRTPGNTPIPVTIEATWWDVLSPTGVYGGSPTIMVDGQPHTNGNDVYAWILGDFFAGLNIGAIGSSATVAGQTVGDMQSSEWFTALPPANMLFAELWPNGTPSDEPFWNEWAAVLNPRSDAYNFAYAERFSAPQISLNPADVATLQLIIEADN